MRLWSVLRESAVEFESGTFLALLNKIPMQWIGEALAATGTATIRRRRLPAEVVIWLVLGMALFRELSIEFIAEHLKLVLPSKSGGRLAKGALPVARARVGSEPLEYLFRRSGKKWAHESADRDRWRGLALYGVDGSTLRVADTPENVETFGKSRAYRGESAYPIVRVCVLMTLRSHLLAGARFGEYAKSEIALAQELWNEIPDYTVTILDRLFMTSDVVCGLNQVGKQRHWLVRMKKNRSYKEIERLGPSDALVELKVSRDARGKNPALPKTFRARRIVYERPGYRPRTLLTSMLDAEAFPAEEIATLHHERWELEIGYDEIKTHTLNSEQTIRSKTAAGVRQELWGVFLAYNLIRLEMERAADEAGISPLRLSFLGALRIIRHEWIVVAYLDAPGIIPKLLRRMRDEIKRETLPPRRTGRSFPRAVKIKMSNYPRKRTRA